MEKNNIAGIPSALHSGIVLLREVCFERFGFGISLFLSLLRAFVRSGLRLCSCVFLICLIYGKCLDGINLSGHS